MSVLKMIMFLSVALIVYSWWILNYLMVRWLLTVSSFIQSDHTCVVIFLELFQLLIGKHTSVYNLLHFLIQNIYNSVGHVGNYSFKFTSDNLLSSSTGRMLLCVRERSVPESPKKSSMQRQFSSGHGQRSEDGGTNTGSRISHFLPTSRRIVQFSNGKVCWITNTLIFFLLLCIIVEKKITPELNSSMCNTSRRSGKANWKA